MPFNALKTCHSCQADVPLHERECPYCEAKQQTAFEAHLAEAVRFLLPRHAPVSILLFISMILGFGLMSADVILHDDYTLRDALLMPPPHIAYQWGAQIQGQPSVWRCITANFVHFGLLHIVFNLMALRYVLPYVERSYGAALTFVTFVALGATSMLCSNLLGSGAIVAGASGALMGAIGMAILAAHRERTTLSKNVRNSMIRWAGFTLVFGFVTNLSGAMGIDNIAHLSGLLAGLLLGALLPRQSTTGFTHLSTLRLSRAAAALTFAALLAAFFQIA